VLSVIKEGVSPCKVIQAIVVIHHIDDLGTMMFWTKLVIFVISPLSIALLLMFLGMIFLFVGRKYLAGGIVGFSLVWLYIWSMPITSHWLSMPMVEQYPYKAPTLFTPADAIVVLGGGLKPANALYPQPDMKSSADRIWFASQLFHAGKAPLLVLSGGLLPDGSLYTEAEAMRILLLELGVPESAMVLEGKSLNTQQNAQQSTILLRERGLNRILLVSSVLHMKRAEIEFKQQGLEVTPAATDYNMDSLAGFMPYLADVSALQVNTQAIKEWVGQFLLYWKYA